MRFALILLTALLLPSPKPSPKPQPPVTAGDPHKPETDRKGTQDDPLVVHIKGTEQSEQETAYNKNKDDREDKRKNYELLLTAMIAAAALAQVATAVVQSCIYRKQSRIMMRSLAATKNAANAALQSVILQKAQLKQWVQLDDWEGHSEHFIPKATRTTYWMSFRVANPTHMPLTLTKVYVATPDRRAVMKMGPTKYVIPPETSYRIEWPTVIADGTVTRLVAGTWEISLVIEVDFVDVFGEDKQSVFTVGCKCHTTHCDVNEYDNRQPA